ncbi:SPW repeat domain-containing protein [Mucilaginibacter sp.]|uniref:SPW repeat domain-containing protein n=1 Tax=Mucilaginibacter sp. TaxID=1882438 RepID=UPI003D132A63
MKPFIPTAVYGVLNYILALTLIASPWLFNLVDISSAALFFPIYIGWIQLIMAIFVKNETGFIKQFPMRVHLVLDVAMGFILMVTPWVYTFSSKAFWPELLMGGALFFLGIFTKKSPFTTNEHRGHAEGLLISTESNY